MLPIPYESTYIETNGVRLHVTSAGPKDGKAVILLHGFPEFWYGWRFSNLEWTRNTRRTRSFKLLR